MSGKKKRGMVMQNTAQKRSDDTETKSKGIARQDRNKSSLHSEPTQKKRGVKPAGDRNAQSNLNDPESNVRPSGISRRDRNAQATDTQKAPPKTRNFRDPNATIDCSTKKAVKRLPNMQGQSTQESGFMSRPGVARGNGMHQCSKDLGLEPTPKTKKMVKKGAQTQSTAEKTSRGVRRKEGNMHDRSTVPSPDDKPKPVAKKVHKGASAFSQTSHEASPPSQRRGVARTGKMNQQSTVLGLEDNPKASTKKKPARGASHHTDHTNLFAGGDHTQPVRPKQTKHMESSFRFG